MSAAFQTQNAIEILDGIPCDTMHLQWDPSNADTLGAWKSALYREVSSFQG